jgi:hypothetical protein
MSVNAKMMSRTILNFSLRRIIVEAMPRATSGVGRARPSQRR